MPIRSLPKGLPTGGHDLSLQSRTRGTLGAACRDEYIAQFRRHCHELIAAGYERLRSERHSASEEDFITQRLKEEVKAAQREGSLPRWADRYFITDQAPVSGPGRVGKDRPKIDIEVESTESCSRPVFHFEAKRLRRDDSHSVSEYVGRAGLGSFIAELYARSGDEGGMLGYVQSESPEYWAVAIERKLASAPREEYRYTDDGTWTPIRLTPFLEHTYFTRHRRPTLGNITIYHTLLSFRTREDDA